MKTLLFLILACTASFAQEFKAIPTGLVSEKDPAINYVVANFDNIPADTLYANAKRYILSRYTGIKNPIVLDEKASLLRFETVDEVMAAVDKKNQKVKYLGTATATLEFKDGKVKISYSGVAVSSLTGETRKELPLDSFWNAKRKLVDSEAKNSTETHFNASTRLLIDAMGKSNVKTASSEW